MSVREPNGLDGEYWEKTVGLQERREAKQSSERFDPSPHHNGKRKVPVVRKTQRENKTPEQLEREQRRKEKKRAEAEQKQSERIECSRWERDGVEVWPGLFIGGHTAVQSLKELKQVPIGDLDLEQVKRRAISAAVTCSKSYRWDFEEIAHHRAPLDHNLDFDRVRDLYFAATDFIHAQLQRPGSVLLHCCNVTSRSPSILIAYLMKHQRKTLAQALALVAEPYPWVDVTKFLHQLDAMETELFEGCTALNSTLRKRKAKHCGIAQQNKRRKMPENELLGAPPAGGREEECGLESTEERQQGVPVVSQRGGVTTREEPEEHRRMVSEVDCSDGVYWTNNTCVKRVAAVAKKEEGGLEECNQDEEEDEFDLSYCCSSSDGE
eukprot:TRINITY_DN5949_c0_g1_i1.p1 TRINITY_DN5949_c0_g1~~TRINITY_DN5949_c0_g1_i1.p1  ORF type:complete len:392 (-),score=95.08 TRINITY_DN5949_c0_g1_i1:80-1219(-)